MLTNNEKRLAEAINTSNYGVLMVYIDLQKLGISDTLQIASWVAALDTLKGVSVKSIKGAALSVKFEEGRCESTTMTKLKSQLLQLMGAPVPVPSPSH